MTDATLLIMFCCNDPDNGSNTGRADAFSFDNMIELDGPFIICKKANDHLLQINRRSFPIMSYQTWIGNWCWDGARVTIPVANAIANYLLSLDKFRCGAGESSLYDAWQAKSHISFENVLEFEESGR